MQQEEMTYTRQEKFDFERLYKLYPRKKGKADGLKICNRKIKTLADYERLEKAINVYRQEVSTTDEKYIKYFSSFMQSWEDHLNADSQGLNRPTLDLPLDGSENVSQGEFLAQLKRLEGVYGKAYPPERVLIMWDELKRQCTALDLKDLVSEAIATYSTPPMMPQLRKILNPILARQYNYKKQRERREDKEAFNHVASELSHRFHADLIRQVIKGDMSMDDANDLRESFLKSNPPNDATINKGDIGDEKDYFD